MAANRWGIVVAGALLICACGGDDGGGDAEPADVEPTVGGGELASVESSGEAGAADDTSDDTSEADGAVAAVCLRNLPDSQDPIGPVTECDEPHRWEYVGEADTVVRTIPDDLADARALFVRTCEQPVSEALGTSIAVPGVSLAYRVDGELGEPVVGTVSCFAGVAGGDHLTSPLGGDVVAALGEIEMIWRLDPGTCFAFLADTVDLGREVPCDEADARVHIGVFELRNGPYPGEDELRAIRLDRCTELLEESGDIDADVESVSGTIPSEPDWVNARRRMITCDALPG